MSRTMDPGELFRRFLEEQTQAHAEGLGTTLPEGLVTPFEDSPVRPLDARGAWHDALAGANLIPDVSLPARWSVPPEWSALLVALDPVADVPMSLGNFPQRVRSLTLLLRRQPSAVPPSADRPDLLEWATTVKEPLPRLLAAGVLRLVGLFDESARLLSVEVPGELESLRANERAALLWQRGDHRAALLAWQDQPEIPAVLLNRGMAHLFLGERAAARPALEAACAVLPEPSAWHHLASVYRTLAELE